MERWLQEPQDAQMLSSKAAGAKRRVCASALIFAHSLDAYRADGMQGALILYRSAKCIDQTLSCR
jgi:hypothetical protein